MFKPYLHVERLDTDETQNLLDNAFVLVLPKIDGTNACIWMESDGTIHTGCRTREITPNNDNAGFATWLESSDGLEARLLKEHLHNHPTHIIYGEWMGDGKRFIGAIKDYTDAAHAHLFIFDIFDTKRREYLPYMELKQTLQQAGLVNWMIPAIAILDHPSHDDILSVAKSNKWLLAAGTDHPGEGVVCKVDGFRNTYGRSVRGKLVLSEYQQMKRKSKKLVTSGTIEKDIIATYVTEAELSKTREKVIVLCDANTFDTTSSKMVGMMMSLIWKDLLAECPNWAKRFKNPTIDFALMKTLCNNNTRAFLKL